MKCTPIDNCMCARCDRISLHSRNLMEISRIDRDADGELKCTLITAIGGAFLFYSSCKLELRFASNGKSSVSEFLACLGSVAIYV